MRISAFEKLYLILTFCLICGGLSYGQPAYQTAIGVRGGFSSGLTIKQFFFREEWATEAILGFRHKGVNATVLVEKHLQAFNSEVFHWYYGLGGHAGFYDGEDYPIIYGDATYTGQMVTAGLDGILGIEYQSTTTLPFAVSVDVKPFIDLLTPGGEFWDGAFAFKIIF